MDFRKRRNGPRLAVFEHGEIALRQSPNRIALSVEDGDVHLNQIGSGSERRLRIDRRRRRTLRGQPEHTRSDTRDDREQ
jgi:hypothetical protein